ncbi:MAG: Type 1 glutamine amidotransferase-like domain-containing protein [Thermaurantimonas sp.]|uniref:Type 1 glutamine amidotransferase-like domain-containing protein n=1 Tax=Thermaurantimonas sp. TaxID=2681568 RepID=UPI00391CD52F
MRYRGILLLICLISYTLSGQSYDVYHTGDTADATVVPSRGIVLMGGAGEHDAAMRWFLQRANGGDVVVLRTSGGSGYQNYLYAQLGVPVNSVRTFVLKSRQHSYDPQVIKYLSRAEAIWIAGGNQATYVNYWKDTPVDSLINHLYNIKGGVVGGISAGMAILTGFYYPALTTSAESNTVLNNPFHSSVTLGMNDFIQIPILQRVIGDTHFNNPDRRGRLITFMARLLAQKGSPVLGIGAHEFCAVTINDSGIARVYGEFPKYPSDRVVFFRLSCDTPQTPEVLASNTPLTWNRGGKALKVFIAPADTNGSVSIDLNDWKTTTGNGYWEDWYVVNGTLYTTPNAIAPTCSAFSGLNTSESYQYHLSGVFPNPAPDKIWINSFEPIHYKLLDAMGKILSEGMYYPNEAIDVQWLPAGIYLLQTKHASYKFLKSK